MKSLITILAIARQAAFAAQRRDIAAVERIIAAA